MRLFLFSFLVLMLSALGGSAYAEKGTDFATQFRFTATIPEQEIVVPTIMELPVESRMQSGIATEFAVYDTSLGRFIPYRIFNVHEGEMQGILVYNLRFLGLPKSTYLVYYGADRPVDIPYMEAGDLGRSEGVLRLGVAQMQLNPRYMLPDTDTDGVVDSEDNCPEIPNKNQSDVDRNGRGDLCEDYDGDLIIERDDNCPTQANERQTDTDGDGVGDVCDEKDNRITEQYPWAPWAGMGVAMLVLIILFILVATAPKKEEEVKIVE